MNGLLPRGKGSQTLNRCTGKIEIHNFTVPLGNKCNINIVDYIFYIFWFTLKRREWSGSYASATGVTQWHISSVHLPFHLMLIKA